MKVQYLILLVAVALEASLSLWPDSFVAASEEAVLLKPARKGKSPRKIRRTIRVRESAPPPPSVPAVPVQQSAQPISNEVHIKPDISVSVSPQQQQEHPHHPPPPPQQQQQVQPVVHVQAPVQPAPQQLVIKESPQQQPIVELPDDDDEDVPRETVMHKDNDDGDDDDDDDDERQVGAENMQIVPYEQPEQSLVPLEAPLPKLRDELQLVPHTGNPLSQVIEVGGNQMKNMPVQSGDLLQQQQIILKGNDDEKTNTGVVQIDGAELNDSLNNIPNANIINRRYRPPGWPLYSNQLVSGFPNALAGQVPVIQVNFDEQVHQPWLAAAAPAPAFVQSPFGPMSPAPLMAAAGPSIPTPMWQQPTASFYPGPPVGAAMPAPANLYQPALYPSAGPIVSAPRVSAYYGAMGPLGQPMVQSPMMMAAASMLPPVVQPIVVQPVMMQPAMMFQPPQFPAEAKKQKRNKKGKKKQVVVEVEEPVIEKETTWIKKEPQFNQYVEEKKIEKPEEIEWETVRIPKRKPTLNAAVAGHQ